MPHLGSQPTQGNNIHTPSTLISKGEYKLQPGLGSWSQELEQRSQEFSVEPELTHN